MGLNYNPKTLNLETKFACMPILEKKKDLLTSNDHMDEATSTKIPIIATMETMVFFQYAKKIELREVNLALRISSHANFGLGVEL